MLAVIFFFFKQKTAYEMRISDWSSDVCSSDLRGLRRSAARFDRPEVGQPVAAQAVIPVESVDGGVAVRHHQPDQVADLQRRASWRQGQAAELVRSAERRVGKEWDSTCRSRWSP